MAHTHKHEKRVWLPDAHLVRAIAESTASLRTSDDEFERAFKILKKYPARVTMFGSARSIPSDPYYKKAEEVAAALSQQGYSVVSSEQRSKRSWRSCNRLQHSPSSRAKIKRIHNRQSRIPLFLYSKSYDDFLCPRLYIFSRRFRHARRIF